MNKPVSHTRAEVKLKEAELLRSRKRADLRQIAAEVIAGVLRAYINYDQKWLTIEIVDTSVNITKIQVNVSAFCVGEQVVKDVSIGWPMRRKIGVLGGKWSQAGSAEQQYAKLLNTYEFGGDFSNSRASRFQPVWDSTNELQGIAVMLADHYILGFIPRNPESWPIYSPEP